MTNSTKENYTEFVRYEHVSWIVPEAVNILMILIDIWVIISLIYFGIKTKKWNAIQKRYTDKLDAGLIYSACVGCTVTLLFRLISSQLAFNVGYDTTSHGICETVYDLSFILYGLVLLFVYLFLWLRQRIFYVNQMLNVSYSKTVRIFSAASIFLIMGSGISVIVLNTLPDNYPSTPSGCIYLPTSKTHDTWSVLSGVAVLIFGQVILLGLFIYPLRRNSSLIDWKSSCCDCFGTQLSDATPQAAQSDRNSTMCTIQMNSNSNNNTSPKKPQSQLALQMKRRQSVTSARIVSIMRRTIIIAVINIVLDVVVTALSFFVFQDGTTRRISILVYDVNLFIGVSLVLGTLSSAKAIFKSPIKGVESMSMTS